MNLGEQITGIKAVMTYSIRKMLLSKKLIITILVAALVTIVMGYAATRTTDKLVDGANMMDSLILSFLMPIVAMVYGASVIRDEIDDKSITHVITSPINRLFAYAGYYTAQVMSLCIIMLFITTCGFIAFFGQTGIDGASLDIYSRMCALIIIGSFVYSSLFLAASVIMEKPIYFGLFYAFIWEGIIGSAGGKLHEVAIKHYIRSIGSNWISYGDITKYAASDVPYSFGVLFVVTAVLLVFGALRFRDKEFP